MLSRESMRESIRENYGGQGVARGTAVMDGKTARSRATSIRPRAISIHYAAPISDRMAHMTLTPTINRRMVPDEDRSSYDYQVKKVVNADVRGIARGRALSMHFSDCKRARQLGGFDKHALKPTPTPSAAQKRAAEEAAAKDAEKARVERRREGEEAHRAYVQDKKRADREKRKAVKDAADAAATTVGGAAAAGATDLNGQ